MIAILKHLYSVHIRLYSTNHLFSVSPRILKFVLPNFLITHV